MASYGRVLSTLHPIIETIFASLSHGLKESQEYHTEKLLQRSGDPHLFLHLARRHACKKMEEAGIHAKLVHEEGNFRMSSIILFHDGLAVWVLHGQEDKKGKVEAPIPGHSESRKRFWRQEPTIPGTETDNILLQWLDNEGELVDPMVLLRPLGGDHTRANLRLNWQGKIYRHMTRLRAEDLEGLEPDWQTEKLA